MKKQNIRIWRLFHFHHGALFPEFLHADGDRRGKWRAAVSGMDWRRGRPFTDAEEEELLSEMEPLSGYEVFIVHTTNENSFGDTEEYAKDYFDA